MQSRCATALAAFLLLGVAACDGSSAHDAADTTAGADDAEAHAETAGAHAETAGAHADSGEALLPIMQRLGTSMTALTYALMTDDFETVESSAAAIAAHAPISAEELERVRTTLGPDMAQFEAFDGAVHEASVRLHEAARERRGQAIVGELAEVQRGCVACHAQFRERLRAVP